MGEFAPDCARKRGRQILSQTWPPVARIGTAATPDKAARLA
jgi:hypothetical protein